MISIFTNLSNWLRQILKNFLSIVINVDSFLIFQSRNSQCSTQWHCISNSTWIEHVTFENCFVVLIEKKKSFVWLFFYIIFRLLDSLNNHNKLSQLFLNFIRVNVCQFESIWNVWIKLSQFAWTSKLKNNISFTILIVRQMFFSIIFSIFNFSIRRVHLIIVQFHFEISNENFFRVRIYFKRDVKKHKYSTCVLSIWCCNMIRNRCLN